MSHRQNMLSNFVPSNETNRITTTDGSIYMSINAEVSHNQPVCEDCVCLSPPFGPLMSLISMMVSSIGLRRRTYSRTMEPATFRASTALLWETSDTSASFTRRMQSFTLQKEQMWICDEKLRDVCTRWMHSRHHGKSVRSKGYISLIQAWAFMNSKHQINNVIILSTLIKAYSKNGLNKW